MQASVVDLRYKTKKIIRALERSEKVSLLYRGRLKGVILPSREGSHAAVRVAKHPFFGMDKARIPLRSVMRRLRGGRYGDL